jgi:hypothetical protein
LSNQRERTRLGGFQKMNSRSLGDQAPDIFGLPPLDQNYTEIIIEAAKG